MKGIKALSCLLLLGATSPTYALKCPDLMNNEDELAKIREVVKAAPCRRDICYFAFDGHAWSVSEEELKKRLLDVDLKINSQKEIHDDKHAPIIFNWCEYDTNKGTFKLLEEEPTASKK
jgi:hypothetical protein